MKALLPLDLRQVVLIKKEYSIAIGEKAGEFDQSATAIAIGFWAGLSGQSGIAIGGIAGWKDQEKHTVALGDAAGQTRQRIGSVAIGRDAGFFRTAGIFNCYWI